jgi:hypothetical protein
MEKNTINNWFFNNSWSLIVVFMTFAVGFALIKYRVDINTQIIYALQERVNAYPTEQYFDLRFKNIETSLDEVKTDLKEHISVK